MRFYITLLASALLLGCNSVTSSGDNNTGNGGGSLPPIGCEPGDTSCEDGGSLPSLDCDQAEANCYLVASPDELYQAAKNARPGDVMLLATGYWQNIDLSVSVSGTEQQPIVIRSQYPGEAVFEGSTRIRLYGDYLELSGVQFQNGYPKDSNGAVQLRGNYNRLTESVFDEFNGPDDRKWVSMYG